MVNDVIFFFNDTATTEIYTLSLHDALPISTRRRRATPRRSDPVSGTFRPVPVLRDNPAPGDWSHPLMPALDRKSTRLNSSHANISYAVFCLKKKKTTLLNNAHLNSTHSTTS